jgi:NhaA family Na+:H+ antiporter
LSAPKRRIVDIFRRFFETEKSGAKVLAIATVVALLWANSPFGDSYGSLWGWNLPEWLTFGGRIPTVKDLVNDGLMTLFFLVVGLEIKRELVLGELSTWRSASLPVVAALGGMVVPALIFLSFNAGTSTESGWAIPAATDIAFAVALLAAFGSRAPSGLKVFLLSLAIVDDIGAILIIAVFYGHAVQQVWLGGLISVVVLLSVFGRARILGEPVLVVAGFAMWVCAVFAGVHPAIAGVALALSLSVNDQVGPTLEEGLHPWTSLLVVPLFALANAGVQITAPAVSLAVTSGLGAGIAGGLLMGKVVGITTFSWLAVKARVSLLPEGVEWQAIVGAAAASGIGFTVSLFISDLAFVDESLVEAAKLSVFAGSLLSATAAAFLLRGIPDRSHFR